MQATIFAKKLTSKDGRQFNRYITKLTRTDGSELTVNVKFREECGEPKSFPCNIIFDKTQANLSQKYTTYTDKNGEEQEAVNTTLWISGWTEGEPYVDSSLDGFI